MLELTNYQIFFMILHGCLLLFAFAYLFGGNSPGKNKKVVSYREFQRQKHRQSAKRKARASQSSQSSRHVREVRDVYAAVPGEDYNPIPRMIEQQTMKTTTRLLAASVEDTLTHFTLTDIDFDID